MIPNSGPPMDIPERYEDVTAEWLTQALRAGGVLGEQIVTNFQVEPVGIAKSTTSTLATFTVQYDGYTQNLPKCMFAKFVSQSPVNRERARQRNLFHREISLYETLGNAIPMEMPQMYFGGLKEGTDVGVLLIEEIRGISKNTLSLDKNSLTSTEIRLALNELSKMHSKWWEDESLAGYEWLWTLDDPARRKLYEEYEESWAQNKDMLEPGLSPTEFRICERLSAYLPSLTAALIEMPVTLCHGDFHISNLIWDKPCKPETVCTLDWQNATRGPAVTDLGWFLGLAIKKSDLKLLQSDFLPGYHAALVTQGVAGYGYEAFLSQFRLGLLDALARLIWSCENIDAANEDIVAIAQTLVGRMTAAAEHMGCGELL